jgi:hypothetical protein
VFDFLRGQEPYKYRFGATDRVDRSYLVPRGATGALLRLKYGVKRGRTMVAPAVAPDTAAALPSGHAV